MRPTTTCADLAEEHQVWAWLAEMWAKVAENYEGALSTMWRFGICWVLKVLRDRGHITPRPYDSMRAKAVREARDTRASAFLAYYDAAGARVRADFCARMARETRTKKEAVRHG